MIVKRLPPLASRNYPDVAEKILKELAAQGLKTYGANKTKQEKEATMNAWTRILEEELIHPAILYKTAKSAYKLFEEFPSIGAFVRAAKRMEEETGLLVRIGRDSSGIVTYGKISTIIPENERSRIIAKLRREMGLRECLEDQRALPESAPLTSEEKEEIKAKILAEMERIMERHRLVR